MIFETEKQSETLLVRLPGASLDASKSNEFKRDVMPLLQSSRNVIFDLGQLTFIDSSGLGAILSCLRQMNGMQGDLKLCRMQKTVRVLFEMVRMNRVFDIHETPEEAAASFKVH
jgi:anti-sigma B factor antagonist